MKEFILFIESGQVFFYILSLELYYCVEMLNVQIYISAATLGTSLATFVGAARGGDVFSPLPTPFLGSTNHDFLNKKQETLSSARTN